MLLIPPTSFENSLDEIEARIRDDNAECTFGGYRLIFSAADMQFCVLIKSPECLNQWRLLLEFEHSHYNFAYIFVYEVEKSSFYLPYDMSCGSFFKRLVGSLG